MNEKINGIKMSFKNYLLLHKSSRQLSRITKKYLALREEIKQLKLKLKELEC